MAEFRNRTKRLEVSLDTYLWGFGIAGFLIIFGLILNAWGWLQTKAVAEQIDAVEKARITLWANWAAADKSVQESADKYAAHWSADFPNKLETAKQNLQDNGTIVGLLIQALAEFKSNHLDQAKQYATDANNLLIASQDVVNKILGPPAYYDDLGFKDGAASGYVEQVKALIVSTRTYLNGLIADAWNSTHGVKLARSYRRATEAEGQIAVATTTLNTRLVGDNVQYDRPKAYEEASVAGAYITDARNWGDSDHLTARSADSSIATAQSSIASAQVTVTFASYNQMSAQMTLNTAASTLGSARAAFWGNPSQGIEPNYQQALDLANLAKSQADQAVDQTVPPPPTSIPSSSGSSSSDSGSSGGSLFDSGSSSDSGSSDSGSWDSGGSDSSSWDSGGSDDSGWDSSSSDDSSWDSGGSDDSSWDSGGSDDGSW